MSQLKFYEDLNIFEKLLYKLHLKNAIRDFSGSDFYKLCEVQSFLESHEVERKWDLSQMF